MDAPELHLRPKLLAAGFSDDEVRRLARAGRLAPLRRGVYVEGELPDDVAARHVLQVRAALEGLAGDVVVSHASAAVLHGLRIWAVPLHRVHALRAEDLGVVRWIWADLARFGPVAARLHASFRPI